MAAKKSPRKKSSDVSAPTKAAEKAGMDARGRAKKYGAPTGKTVVTESGSKSNKRGAATSSNINAVTTVQSARGNLYRVSESKTQRFMARDTKPNIIVRPVAKTFTTNQSASNQKRKKK